MHMGQYYVPYTYGIPHTRIWDTPYTYMGHPIHIWANIRISGRTVLIVTDLALDDGDESDEAMEDLILVTKRPLLYQLNVFAMSLHVSSPLLSFSSQTNYLFLHQNLNVGCLNPGYLDS